VTCCGSPLAQIARVNDSGSARRPVTGLPGVWHPVIVIRRTHRVRLAVVAVSAVALAASGCGSPAPKSAAPGPGQIHADLSGSPAPLAGLHAQANQLLSGGQTALDARLKALKGYPVVINKWAEWCGPCASEFPILQRVAAQYGRKVAFLGLDSNDYSGPAKTFLGRFPVTYPSYVDPHGSLAQSVGAGYGQPLTVFITAAGKQVFVHSGAYPSASQLTHDIQFYVLK
jgi:cytochrome c biogenesis protein CcmG/thiol:disulfide interchange protein DsbE